MKNLRVTFLRGLGAFILGGICVQGVEAGIAATRIWSLPGICSLPRIWSRLKDPARSRTASGQAGQARVPGEAVTLMRTPDGGIQPQVAVDRNGVVHLIYFKGDPSAGDVYYVRRARAAAEFSAPIRVNSVPGSAVAVGSVRGAQIALGRGGRVHVAWLGSAKAQPRGPNNATPMIYTRLNEAGTAFEPQRNVLQFAEELDGGGSVAADNLGNVYVAWHGNPLKNGEANRQMWVARSEDDGKTFARETAAYSEPTGACGCCGMRAFADAGGALYILYRAATAEVHRDMVLLVSKDHGHTFFGSRVAKWEINACPMSTAAIAAAGPNVVLAWETAGQVFFAGARDTADVVSIGAFAAPGDAQDRKHPAVAANRRGETLLAWTEGTAWERGGSVAWQVFDARGRAGEVKGSAPGVPVWGLVAAYARPDGGFVILY